MGTAHHATSFGLKLYGPTSLYIGYKKIWSTHQRSYPPILFGSNPRIASSLLLQGLLEELGDLFRRLQGDRPHV